MADSTIEILIKARDAASKVINEINREFAAAKEAADNLNNAKVDHLNESLHEAQQAAEDLAHVKTEELDEELTGSSENATTLAEKLKIVGKASVKVVTDEVKRLNQVLHNVRGAADEAQAALQRVRDTGAQIVKNQIGKSLFAGGTVKLAGDFSLAIGEISTLIDDADTSTQELTQSVTDLSNQFGQNKSQVATAFYNALSKGASDATEANELLQVAAQTAIGGATDINTAVNGLTSVINAFGKNMSDAREVSDVLFTTMKNGGTTIGELSSYFFQAAPIANALGASLEDVSASIVALTLSGTPTATAMTQVRAALAGIIRPGGEAEKAFQAAGFASAKAAIEAVGLQGAFEILNRAAAGSEGQLQKMVGSIEGVQAILQTTGKNADNMKDALNEIENGAGATQVAFDKMNATLGQTLNEMGATINNFFTTIGTAIGTAIQPLIAGFTAVLQSITELMQEYPRISTFFGGLFAAFIGLKVLLGTVIFVFGVLAQAALKLFIFNKLGAAVGLFSGALGQLVTVLKAVQIMLVRTFGAAAVAAVRNALVALGAAALSTSGKLLSMLGLTKLSAVFTGLAASMKGLTTTAIALSGAASTLGTVLRTMLGPLGLLAAAVGGVSYVFYELAEAEKESRKQTEANLKNYIAIGDEIANVKKITEALQDPNQELDRTTFEGYRDGLVKAKKNLEELLKKAQDGGDQEAVDAATEAIAKLEKQIIRTNNTIAALPVPKVVDSAKVAQDQFNAMTQAATSTRDSLLELNDFEADRAISELEDMKKAAVADLAGAGDFAGALKARDDYNRKIIAMEQARAEEANRIARNEAMQQLEYIGKYVEDEAEAAAARKTIAENLAQARIDNEKRVAAAVSSQLEQAKSNHEALTKKIIDLKKKEVAETQRQSDVLFNIEQQGRTDIERYRATRARVDQKNSEARKALMRGEFDLAEKLAREAEQLAASNTRGVKTEDGRELVSDAQARSRALEQVKKSQDLINQSIAKQKRLAEEAQRAEAERIERLTASLNRLNDAIEKLAQVKIDVAMDVNGEDPEAALQKINEQQKPKTGGKSPYITYSFDPDKKELDKAIDEIPEERRVKVYFDYETKSYSDRPHSPGQEEYTPVPGGYATGGHVRGPGTGTSDSILARLSNNEFVLRAKAVKKYGLGYLNSLNNLSLPKFAQGGLVGNAAIADAGGPRTSINLTLGNETFALEGSQQTGDRLTQHVRREALKFGRRRG